MIRPDHDSDWPAFYAATRDQGPHITTARALRLRADAPHQSEHALDLGCGAGRDTRAMLRHGFHVTAVDIARMPLRRLFASLSAEERLRVALLPVAFELFSPARRFAMVNSSLAMSFCRPEAFDEFCSRALGAVERGGLFAGHFLGVNDEWAKTPTQTFLTRARVASFFSEFSFELFLETEIDDQDALGRKKHWHIFGVVARRTKETNT